MLKIPELLAVYLGHSSFCFTGNTSSLWDKMQPSTVFYKNSTNDSSFFYFSWLINSFLILQSIYLSPLGIYIHRYIVFSTWIGTVPSCDTNYAPANHQFILQFHLDEWRSHGWAGGNCFSLEQRARQPLCNARDLHDCYCTLLVPHLIIVLLFHTFHCLQFFLTLLASTLPVPSGSLIPIFKIGAAFGRIIGEAMQLWFPEGLRIGAAVAPILPG